MSLTPQQAAHLPECRGRSFRGGDIVHLLDRCAGCKQVQARWDALPDADAIPEAEQVVAAANDPYLSPMSYYGSTVRTYVQETGTRLRCVHCTGPIPAEPRRDRWGRQQAAIVYPVNGAWAHLSCVSGESAPETEVVLHASQLAGQPLYRQPRQW